MNNSEMNYPCFINNTIMNINDQDNEIEEKFKNRKETFNNQDDFFKVKENVIINELNTFNYMKKTILEKKRIHMNINIEQIHPLKSKMTIPLDYFEQCNKMEIQLSQFNEIINNFKSNNKLIKYKGLVGIRKLISLKDSPIRELINMNIITDLMLLLDTNFPEFQYESLSCLINISSGSSSKYNLIVSKGGIPKIIKLLDSDIEEIKIQAIWIIGNLASDKIKIRNTLINEKVIDKLIIILSSSNNNQIIKQTTRTLLHFFKLVPHPPFNVFKKILKSIARVMIILPSDTEFLSDACFILCFISTFYKNSIKDILELDLMSQIIKNLEIDSKKIKLNCLKIIGNIACGNANQTQKLIDLGIISYLKKCIYNEYKIIRKETVWIISNIAAGTQKQIETLIDENMLPILNHILMNDENSIKKECIWAICNLTVVENPLYIKKIFEQGILKIICECIKMDDSDTLGPCLEAFDNLLSFGKKLNTNPAVDNPVVEEVEKMEMFDTLEKLQFHPNDIIYENKIYKY